MENFQREDLETISQKQELEQLKQAEKRAPYSMQQRILAWIAVAVVLFGLGGSLYWMFSFVPGA